MYTTHFISQSDAKTKSEFYNVGIYFENINGNQTSGQYQNEPYNPVTANVIDISTNKADIVFSKVVFNGFRLSRVNSGGGPNGGSPTNGGYSYINVKVI